MDRGAGAGWLLAYFGYLPNVAQSARTVNGIVMMMSMIVMMKMVPDEDDEYD